MNNELLSINFGTLKEQCDFRQAVDVCLRHGVTTISPWREQVAEIGLGEARRIVEANGLRLSGYCRGGFFPAGDPEQRRARFDDNKRAVDEAAALRAACLVLVVGGLPEGSRDLAAAHRMVADGIAELLPHAQAAGVRLAIEPLHPMYAADRACVNTLAHALDIAEPLGPDVGVAIDVYHVWWDPDLAAQIARAGRQNRIFAHHICDWLAPTKSLLTDRGMMGDGVIDLAGIRRMVEAAGFRGPQEVEIFSSEVWWRKPADEVVATAVERFHACCQV